jgi:parallel beta-helix repeat protein
LPIKHIITVKKAGKLRRIASSILVALLFLSLSVFAFTVQPAKAQSGGTIIINRDGSISSPVGHAANITKSGNAIYTFTGNNYLPIIVNRSNIIINGMGHTLQASGGNGFSLTLMSNVTIKDTTITNSDYGINLIESNSNVLSDNNITANNCGIYLFYSLKNTLSGNTVTRNSGDGVDLYYSSDNNTLSGNNVTANGGVGIYLFYSSSGNVLSGNVMASNMYNFGVYGTVLSDFMNKISTSNLVDGKPVYYLINQLNIVISPKTYPAGVGYLSLVNCKNVTVQGLTLTKNLQGLLLAFTTNSKITGNNVTANGRGIYLYSSSSNVLSGNNVTANSNDGIYVESSVHNTLSGNNITANSGYGIYIPSSSDNVFSHNNVAGNNFCGINFLYSSDNNTLSGNNITGNSEDGIDLYYSSDNNTLSGNNITGNNGDGIYLETSSGNVLSDNNITANSYDGFDLYSSSGNVFSGNNVTANSGDGFDLYSSSGNRIFHNDFLNNTQQTYVFNSTNTWDDGYPSGGNYWSNYTGVDLKSGPYQNLTGSDGIGDTPYVIDSNNTDHYPLMGPFHTFNVGTWKGVAYSVDTVSNSTITNLSFNQLAKTITFYVTGKSGTTGFCRVAISKKLMSGSWTVTVNGTQVLPPNLSITTDANYTYIYFTYHHSTETVQIISTSTIPEFQPSMLLPLFMIITLIGAIIFKRKRKVRN